MLAEKNSSLYASNAEILSSLLFCVSLLFLPHLLFSVLECPILALLSLRYPRGFFRLAFLQIDSVNLLDVYCLFCLCMLRGN